MPRVHPSAVIGPQVQLGERVAIGPHAVLLGHCQIGDDCWIGPGVVVGTPPEVASDPHTASWAGEPPSGNGLVIGPRTVLREYTTVHSGFLSRTQVGADCFVMNKVYIAHDAVISDAVTMASSVTLGGHVRVGRAANLGMNSVVHQHRVVGPVAMVGMGTVVTRDVPPFAMVHGNPGRVRGVNVVGMKRAGHDVTAAELVARAYEQGQLPGADLPAELVAAFAWWGEQTPQRPLLPAADTAGC
jgi:UDP-N-acetylglucosamine acyltransferase